MKKIFVILVFVIMLVLVFGNASAKVVDGAVIVATPTLSDFQLNIRRKEQLKAEYSAAETAMPGSFNDRYKTGCTQGVSIMPVGSQTVCE